MLNPCSFEAPDSGVRRVRQKGTRASDAPLPMGERPSRRTDLAGGVAPWHDRTVDLGVRPPHPAGRNFHRIRFADRQEDAGARNP